METRTKAADMRNTEEQHYAPVIGQLLDDHHGAAVGREQTAITDSASVRR